MGRASLISAQGFPKFQGCWVLPVQLLEEGGCLYECLGPRSLNLAPLWNHFLAVFLLLCLSMQNISSIFYIYLPSLLLWSALYKTLAMTMSFPPTPPRKCSEHHIVVIAVWCNEVIFREKFCNACRAGFTWGWAALCGNCNQTGTMGKSLCDTCRAEVC